jgi:hypothetical protein
MSRSTTSRTVPAILAAIVLLSAVAVGATGAFGRTVTPTPEPSAPPTVEPSVPPTTPPSEPPTVPPTEAPSDDPSRPPADGVFDVDLDNLTGHDVSVVVDDETDSVVEVTSGRPGDGMSVRWFDLNVENIDAETLRIVWVGLPRDEVVHLGVSRVDGKVRLRFDQDGPPPNSDAIGFDRVLKIKFVVPVRAEDVLASIQETLDTID